MKKTILTTEILLCPGTRIVKVHDYTSSEFNADASHNEGDAHTTGAPREYYNSRASPGRTLPCVFFGLYFRFIYGKVDQRWPLSQSGYPPTTGWH